MKIRIIGTIVTSLALVGTSLADGVYTGRGVYTGIIETILSAFGVYTG